MKRFYVEFLIYGDFEAVVALFDYADNSHEAVANAAMKIGTWGNLERLSLIEVREIEKCQIMK